MNIKKIIVGKWYKTKQGTGLVERVGGTHPPSMQMLITSPFPRGVIYVSPREVEEEVPEPKPANLGGNS